MVFSSVHMMFAERVDIDLFDDDHVFAVLVENGIADHLANRLFVTFGEEDQRLRMSTRERMVRETAAVGCEPQRLACVSSASLIETSTNR